MTSTFPAPLTSTVSLKSVPRHRELQPNRSILRRQSISNGPQPQSSGGANTEPPADPWRFSIPNMNHYPPPTASSSTSSSTSHAPHYPPFVSLPHRRSMLDPVPASAQVPPPIQTKVQVHPYLRPPGSTQKERMVWDMRSPPQSASLSAPGHTQVPFCSPQILNTVVTQPNFNCLRLGFMLSTSSTPLRNRRGGRIRGWQVSVQASNPRVGVTLSDLLSTVWWFMEQPAAIQAPANPYLPAQTRKQSDCLAGCTAFAGLVDDAEFIQNEDDQDDYIPGMLTLICGLP